MSILLSDELAGVGSPLLQYGDEITADYTLQRSDSNRPIIVNSADPVILTIPANLPRGWFATITRLGPGAVTFATAAGVTPLDPFGGTAISVQYGKVMLEIPRNDTGAAPLALLSGLTA